MALLTNDDADDNLNAARKRKNSSCRFDGSMKRKEWEREVEKEEEEEEEKRSNSN